MLSSFQIRKTLFLSTGIALVVVVAEENGGGWWPEKIVVVFDENASDYGCFSLELFE